MHEDREKGRASAQGTEGGSSGMNSLLRELSLSLSLPVCRALSHPSFYRIMLFTDSVVSFWRTPWAEEKEKACEERDWVRSESWPAGVIFTRMAFSGMRDWRCDMLWDVFEVEGTRWTNNPPPSACGHCTYCICVGVYLCVSFPLVTVTATHCLLMFVWITSKISP